MLIVNFYISRWFEGDRLIPNARASTLHIPEVLRTQHGKSIRCEATNSVGTTAQSFIINIECKCVTPDKLSVLLHDDLEFLELLYNGLEFLVLLYNDLEFLVLLNNDLEFLVLLNNDLEFLVRYHNDFEFLVLLYDD